MKTDKAGKGLRALVLALPALATSSNLSLLLSGCIASYSIRHEDPIEETPDAALVCRYNWSADEPFFRSENVYSYHWAPASQFGHRDFAAALRDFTGACPVPDSADRPEARISAHALRRAKKFNRSAMAIPMAYATGFTLGFMPIPMTDYFAVCLEITPLDGIRRAAIAQGQLNRFANMWGSSNHRYNQGKDEQKQKVDQIIREVANQAWRKTWLPAQEGSQTIASCRDELDAIAKGSPTSSGTAGPPSGYAEPSAQTR